jgi:hypothetical protein
MTIRADEAAIIRQANRASAVGQLLLGRFQNWPQFLSLETENLEKLPRRMLRSGKADIKERLSREISKFCEHNFVNMDIAKLNQLYEEIMVRRGLEIPLPEFEARFAKVKDHVLMGQPRHATVVVSLFGLQFKYPEDILAKDIAEALALLCQAESMLEKYKNNSHQDVLSKRDEISSALRLQSFSCHACILSCFNLIEAFLNGLAWDFLRSSGSIATISEKNKKLLQDGSIREKLINYPKIISGTQLWTENDEPLKSFLEQVKPFRDSLVHPSPFSKPERYGGIDKLEHLYRIDPDKAREASKISAEVIEKILQHIQDYEVGLPVWLQDLRNAAGKTCGER